MLCLGCKKDKPIKAKGLCNKCYMRFQRHGDISWERKKKGDTLCSYCHKRPVHAKGLCGSCYSRYLSNGSPEITKVKKVQICKHCGKMGYLKAKGYCGACYKRALAHGGNPNIIKKKQVKECKFCKKVRTIKAKGFCATCYQRYKKTGSAEYTKVVHFCKVKGCNKPVVSHGLCDKHRTQIRIVDRRKAMNAHLIRRFEITMDDYEKMHDDQGGVCAICGQYENIRKNGHANSLSVDHCHESGKVRGLLCNKCNIALGAFQESIEILTKAINYLNNSTK